MFPNSRAKRRTRRTTLVIFLVLGLVAGGVAFADVLGDKLTWAERDEILVPVNKWAAKLKESKNEFGEPNKRAILSKIPIPIDEESYLVSVHVNTAEPASQLTERFELTVKKVDGAWAVVDEKVADSFTGLYRPTGGACYGFDSLDLDREGLKLSGGKGNICETYVQGEVTNFTVVADNMKYDYQVPTHATVLHIGRDYGAVQEIINNDHARQLDFDPDAAFFQCDPATCETLLKEHFTGLQQPSRESRADAGLDFAGNSAAGTYYAELAKERRENAFAHFARTDFPDNHHYTVFVAEEVRPTTFGFLESAIPGYGVLLQYNNWGGYEVEFGVVPKRLDQAEQLSGTIFGYYTEETLQKTDAYELERREGIPTRWHEVYKVKGKVDMARDNPEMMDADIEFGIKLKQDVRELPFSIISFSSTGAFGTDRPAPLFVNSVQMDGKDLTWVRTGGTSGRVLLPQAMPAGSEIDLRMNFSTRSIVKFNPSFSYVNRFGWMPFVDFGDFIDEFELEITVPSQYQVLGIGHKLDERVEDRRRISHWRADNPVVFPSIIFGKYRSDVPADNALATKLDGTPIPVEVHVDTVSFSQWDIKPDSLRPIATQAAASINIYNQISGLDYPYGGLNLVADPVGSALYGQAPSSLIYLGWGVFRGAAELTPFFQNPASISKFLKSVTAHEVGHQWWGSRVSNANDRNYWFVESLAEYFSALYLEIGYGYDEYQQQVDDWRRAILATEIKQSVQNANTLWQGENQGAARREALYAKGPYAFHMLRETFKAPEGPRGPDGADAKFFEFLKAFTQELAEKREIVSLDIQRAAEKALGGIGPDGQAYNVDLDWFFGQWIRGTGIPQYQLEYDSRPAEDGSWVVEGVVRQRVVIGNDKHIVPIQNQVYRGVVDLTIKVKGADYQRRIIVDAAETPFQLKVPRKPLEVALNKHGEILAHDTVVNESW